MVKKFKTLGIILIFVLGFFLRWHNYAVYPQKGATHDEFAFAFLGLSLWQTGLPASWSNIPVYNTMGSKYYLSANGTNYSIVTPYFDHPPLFGFLTGGLAFIKNERNFSEVKLATIRQLPVILGTLSLALLYFWVKSLYGEKIAILSSLIYATVPTYVISSRMALAENLLVFESLLAGIVLEKFLRQRRTIWLSLLGITCGLAFLTKVSGVFVFLSSVFFLIFKQKKRAIFTAGLFFFLIASSYFFYGFLLDKSLFWKILNFQGSRETGPLSFFNLFMTPSIVNKIFVDGWVYFGWFALFLLFSDWQKNLKILLPAIAYLLIFVLTVDQRDLHGWYSYPFYPYLAIASGLILARILDKPGLLSFLFLLTAGFSAINLTYFQWFGYSANLFRLLAIFFFLPFFLEIFRIPSLLRFSRIIFRVDLISIFILNILAVINYVHPA